MKMSTSGGFNKQKLTAALLSTHERHVYDQAGLGLTNGTLHQRERLSKDLDVFARRGQGASIVSMSKPQPPRALAAPAAAAPARAVGAGASAARAERAKLKTAASAFKPHGNSRGLPTAWAGRAAPIVSMPREHDLFVAKRFLFANDPASAPAGGGGGAAAPAFSPPFGAARRPHSAPAKSTTGKLFALSGPASPASGSGRLSPKQLSYLSPMSTG